MAVLTKTATRLAVVQRANVIRFFGSRPTIFGAIVPNFKYYIWGTTITAAMAGIVYEGFYGDKSKPILIKDDESKTETVVRRKRLPQLGFSEDGQPQEIPRYRAHHFVEAGEPIDDSKPAYPRIDPPEQKTFKGADFQPVSARWVDIARQVHTDRLNTDHALAGRMK